MSGHEHDANKITRLRALLEEKPRSAKLMAQLSVALTDQAETAVVNKSEALTLARKAALLCPTRPAGFVALSLASPHFDERMESLEKAVNLWTPTNCSMTRCSLAGCLARLLVEPRDEEVAAKKKKELSSRASSLQQHASKRNLNEEEVKLYERTQEALALAWEEEEEEEEEDQNTTTTTTTKDTTVYLARVEYKLGLLFRKMQPIEEHRPRCIAHLTTASDKLPDDHAKYKTARFWLATLNDGSPDRCPEEYVVNLYSTFAANFDNLLVDKLHYETPTKLRALLNETIIKDTTTTFKTAADLGCGTGLSGMAFRDCIEDSLTGVDLSPEMVTKARERKNCYDYLEVGDVTCILNDETKKFDLIFCCDVFCYIGNLSPVFAAVQRALQQPGGVFCFSTEYLKEGATAHPLFALHECARFAHKTSYIESLAAEFGFDICKLIHTPIRKNGGKDVQGTLVVMQRASSSSS